MALSLSSTGIWSKESSSTSSAKGAVFYRQQRLIGMRPEYHDARQRAENGDHYQRDDYPERYLALLFDEAHVALDSFALKARRQHGHYAVDRADEENERVKIPRLEVYRGKGDVEINKRENGRDDNVYQHASAGLRNPFARGLRARSLRLIILAAEVGPVKASRASAAGIVSKMEAPVSSVEVDFHYFVLSFRKMRKPFRLLSLLSFYP
jgi:hypothetical protein